MGRGIGHTQFEAVYTQYYARFVIIARRYVRDVAVAEDIVMESFGSGGKPCVLRIDFL